MTELDLLIEIGTEELPPRALSALSNAFTQGVTGGLTAAGVNFSSVDSFATPRRLAMIINGLQTRQQDTQIEKLGPALKAAFDADGKPTKAAEGFARSCGVGVSDLQQHDDGKITKLMYRASKPGVATRELVPDIVKQALAELPIPKRMRWGSSREEFVRPVHWAILLFGKDVIPATILGVETGNLTYGHRFHHPQAIALTSPEDYSVKLIQEGSVIPDFTERRKIIREQVVQEGRSLSATAVIDEDLLDEVTSLVEWPVALTGSFDREFLAVPQQALISAMKEHQKCFHLLSDKGEILPNFITVSNLQSRDMAQVIHGNEKVVRPRLADAAFFFAQDKKQTLESRREKLKTVVFQQQLGTVYDKSERVKSLAVFIAGQLHFTPATCIRAAELGKCDLLTSMVYEFADLQGIMGYHYALHDGEDEQVAQALYEQYLPKFSGDDLPQSDAGTALALAERIDTITGLFAIGQPPTGSKDPFALRRAALGILRILVELKLDLDLGSCIAKAGENFQKLPMAENPVQDVLDFIFERFRAWYSDQGISTDVFQAVDAVRPLNPYEFDLRVKAVARFKQLPEAEALAAANKRVSNILAKLEKAPTATINRDLLQEKAEGVLTGQLDQKVLELEPLFVARDYTGILESLASLQQNVDNFFDQVMVNTDDGALRTNRLALLQQLRLLFLRTADISFLQT
ncbi:MAG: glycine--tRNA ligase subunit beta [Pseudohongiellaceae bacterium]